MEDDRASLTSSSSQDVWHLGDLGIGEIWSLIELSSSFVALHVKVGIAAASRAEKTEIRTGETRFTFVPAGGWFLRGKERGWANVSSASVWTLNKYKQ